MSGPDIPKVKLMSTADVRRSVKQRVDRLSEDRLRVADDFPAYLEERDASEATAELLGLPGFLDALRQAEAEITIGRTVSVRDLRRRY
jgi:hypothetical protein